MRPNKGIFLKAKQRAYDEGYKLGVGRGPSAFFVFLPICGGPWFLTPWYTGRKDGVKAWYEASDEARCKKGIKVAIGLGERILGRG